MPLSTYGIGKGLREPVSPFRVAYAFGAELGTFNTEGWSGIPAVVEPTYTFDLSQISYGHEIGVALAVFKPAQPGTYQFRWRLIRVRDGALLVDSTSSGTVGPEGWFYVYGVWGWFDWEVNENGSYSLVLSVSGPESHNISWAFEVTGIAAPTPTPIPVGDFMPGITNSLLYAKDWFIEAFRICSGWIWPFNLLAEPLDWIQYAFGSAAYHFSNFALWVNDVSSRVTGILDQVAIIGLLRTWLDYASWAWAWVVNAAINVSNIVNTWWSSTRYTVLAMIDEASQVFTSLYNTLLARVGQLESLWNEFRDMVPTMDEVIHWWGNWTGELLSVVNTWWTGAMVEVQGLINSAFVIRGDFWAGWQDWRDKVTEFFSDPEDWLYKAVDRIIERYW